MNSIPLKAIGVIHTSFKEAKGTPIQPIVAEGATGTVTVFEKFQDGLRDLEGFERIWLIYWFHQAPRARLLVTPFLDDHEHGVFATRAPVRPNPVGMSSVRLLRRDGNVLTVADVDMIDGTVLLDIKPYVPKFDSFQVKRSGWLDRGRKTRRVADGRFGKGSGER